MHQARTALQAAIQRGRVKKSDCCQAAGCSSQAFIEAHHWSYEREHWRDVLWVCAAHHRQGHARGRIEPAAGIPSHLGIVPELQAKPIKEAP